MTALVAAARTASTVPVGHLLGETVLWLAVIVVALFGLKYLAKRRKSPSARLGKMDLGNLTVVSRQSIGKGQWIAVVEADGKRVLVGISGAGFTRLGELDGNPPAEVPRGTPTFDFGRSAASPSATPTSATTKRAGILERVREATVRR